MKGRQWLWRADRQEQPLWRAGHPPEGERYMCVGKEEEGMAKRKSCLRPGVQRKAEGTTEDIHPDLKSCTGKTKKVIARAPVTCSASPGGKLSNLIPPLLLKIIALHTANGFGCLPAHHDHHLERKDKS